MEHRETRLGPLSRRGFLGALGVSALGSLALRDGAAQPGVPRRPNIVVLLADDLGYGELGCYGGAEIPTPHIDSLAANGVRFTDSYVSCPLCSPTRAGLMTGRYQQRFGHEHNPGPEQTADAGFGLAEDEVTLAERLRPLGYATGMVGKWHLGYREGSRPNDRGFDEFYGFLGGAHEYLAKGQAGLEGIVRDGEPVEETEYLTDALGREACAFIERHRGDPFLLYLPFNAVHTPLQSPDPYLERFAGVADPKRRTFCAMLSAMDDNVGRVLATLRGAGLEEETLIFFWSDNGGPTPATTCRNTPLRGTKATMWEGGIRVPAMVQWKGHIAPSVVEHPVISLDIHPTAVAATGAPVDPTWALDGVSLLRWLDGSAPDSVPHRTLCWRMGDKHAIRDGHWKLLTEPGAATDALFDLSTDIGETRDLAAEQPERVESLSAAWAAWSEEMADPKWGERATRPAAGARQTFEQRFGQLDADGDGAISREESGKLPRIGRRFDELDANGDGKVTKDEARGKLGGFARGR